MQMFRLLITGGMLLLLTGCFQVTTVVHVNPDGSGTVEESLLLSKKIVASIEEMMQGFGGESGGKPKHFDLFEPAKLKEQASAMGTGVTYRSGKKMETADYSGYTATYAFTDINTLKLSQQSGAPTGDKPEMLPLTFHYQKGSPATLTIEQPQAKTAAKAPVPPSPEPAVPAVSPEQMSPEAKKFMETFMGMKFVLVVDVNGTIVSTNATHRDGQRLTLVEFDLAKLGGAGPELEKLTLLQNSSLEDAKELLKGIPGIKMDMNDRLTVVFKQ